MVKNLLASAGNARDEGLIPGSRVCLGGGNGNLLQDSCLENPTDRGAWWATVHVVTVRHVLATERTHTHIHTLHRCWPHSSQQTLIHSFILHKTTGSYHLLVPNRHQAYNPLLITIPYFALNCEIYEGDSENLVKNIDGGDIFPYEFQKKFLIKNERWGCTRWGCPHPRIA